MTWLPTRTDGAAAAIATSGGSGAALPRWSISSTVPKPICSARRACTKRSATEPFPEKVMPSRIGLSPCQCPFR